MILKTTPAVYSHKTTNLVTRISFIIDSKRYLKTALLYTYTD